MERIESQKILEHTFFLYNLDDHKEYLKKHEEIKDGSMGRNSDADSIYVLSEDYLPINSLKEKSLKQKINKLESKIKDLEKENEGI